MSRKITHARTAPAVAMTVVSMVLTLAVVVGWLGGLMPWPLALLIGLGLDGAWLTVHAYERRLAAQGDHSPAVTAIGWLFGLVASGVLVAHALTSEGTAAWLAVSWLPVGAKAAWLVHGLWERTAVTPDALRTIREVQQRARDEAAVARARLRAEATSEETRLVTVTQAGARVARVQARTAGRLAEAWEELAEAHKGDGTGTALTCVTTPVTAGVTPRWDLPVWGPVAPALPPAGTARGAEGTALTDDELDALVREIRDSEHPPLSYREMALRFRAQHSASETRLRAAWRRVTTATTTTG